MLDVPRSKGFILLSIHISVFSQFAQWDLESFITILKANFCLRTGCEASGMGVAVVSPPCDESNGTDILCILHTHSLKEHLPRRCYRPRKSLMCISNAARIHLQHATVHMVVGMITGVQFFYAGH